MSETAAGERRGLRFDELAASLDQLEGTSSRNELVRILAELYGRATPAEVAPISYLVQGRLAPFFVPLEIGLGERLIVTAAATAYGLPKEQLAAEARRLGDLGTAVRQLAP